MKKAADSGHCLKIGLAKNREKPKNRQRFKSSGLRKRMCSLRLEEDWLHRDKGEVVGLRQALVADVAKCIPGERRESVLCRGPVYRFCSELPSHEKVCHLFEGEEELPRTASPELFKAGVATAPWCHSSPTGKASLLSGRHDNRRICKGHL